MKRSIFLPILILLTSCFSATTTTQNQAQNPAGDHDFLPLGTVSAPMALTSCPVRQGVRFPTGAQCFETIVSDCPGTLPLKVTYGVNTPSAPIRGTIIMHDGGGGVTTFDHGPHDGRNYADSFFQAGYRTVEVVWGDDANASWEDTGLPEKNIRVAACRPATLFKHIYDNVHGGSGASGGMCGLGQSGGTGALAFSLSWYGAGDYFDKVMFSSGPVFSDISKGCEDPTTPVEVCPPEQFGCTEGGGWLSNPSFAGHTGEITGWSGIQTCGNQPTNDDLNKWRDMSIIPREGSVYVNFPKTAISAWLCNIPSGQPSGPLGSLYFEKFTNASQVASTPSGDSAYSVNTINNCTGEGTWNGTQLVDGVQQPAYDQMLADMFSADVGCVKRH